MKNRIKCIVALIMVISSMLCLAVFVVPAQAQSEENEYILTVLNAYMNINGLDTSELYISQAVNVLDSDGNETEKNVYLVKSDKEIVAKMIVQRCNDEYISSFDCDVAVFNDCGEEINLAIYEQDDILVYYINGGYAIFKNDVESMDVCIDNPAYSHIVFKKIVLNQKARSNPEVTSLSVPFVGNETINGSGVCWAASVAMDYQYRTGVVKTAEDVYNQCINSSYFHGELPIGNEYWVQAAFKLYGRNTTHQASGMIYPRVYSLLSEKKTVYIAVSDGKGFNHALLLIGSYYDGSVLVYTLRDSNTDKIISAAQPISVVDNPDDFLYVTTYGITFTEWYKTIY